MQLKAGFQLMTTSTHLLPSVPSHNNNQPFSNVNLAVNEIQADNDGGEGDEGEEGANREQRGRVTLYSLYDDHAEENDGGGGGGVDAQLPRPSENLKFITNEYGFLELLEEDDDGINDSSSSITLSSSSSSDSDSNALDCDDDEDADDASESPTVSCITCGHYALLREFYDAKHCTYDCSVITRINECKIKKELEEKEEKLSGEDQLKGKQELHQKRVKREVDEVTPVAGQEIKRIRLMGEGEETGRRVVVDNPFRVNDLLEAIDPQHQSLFCPVTVVEVIGYRLLLKFVGYSDKYSFWANADSKYIFPVNWSKRFTAESSSQLHFHGPPNFTWESYVASNECCRVAPDSNFPHINAILNWPETKVRVGMKVEAVDRRNKNLICVATVSCVLGDRFLIHFDSWDSLYDYWTFIGSGDVFYCGYCKDHGIDITPPHCYEDASEFDWDEYLKKTNSVAMPRDLMEHAVPLPFNVGEQVEVVDKRSPRLLRLAHVQSIVQETQTLTVHFPSLKSPDYDYDIHAHSENIHPLGWGTSTGHPLADDYEISEDTRRSPSPDHSNFPTCPNHKLCKSVCNVRGPNFPFHSKMRDCPYSIPNMQEYSESGKFTDRVVVFEDAHYDLGGGNNSLNPPDEDTTTPEETPPQTPPPQEPIEKKEDPIEFKPPIITLNLKACVQKSHHTQHILSRNSNPINFNNFTSPTKPQTSTTTSQSTSPKSTSEIPKRSEILTWSHDRISSLVQSLCSNLPTAQKVADQFRSNLIDGESFLMLTQNDMTEALGIKLGPAVKIYNLIRLIDLNK